MLGGSAPGPLGHAPVCLPPTCPYFSSPAPPPGCLPPACPCFSLLQEDFGGEEENPDGFVLTGGLPAAEADPAAAPAEAGAANEAGPAAAAAPGAAGAAPGGKGGAAGAAAATSFREDEDGVVLLDSDDEGPEPGPSRAAGALRGAVIGAGGGGGCRALPAAGSEQGMQAAVCCCARWIVHRGHSGGPLHETGSCGTATSHQRPDGPLRDGLFTSAA